ncbi:hypothetical protein OOU_Y34scaffold00995g1 [Pyricularia oryzae Y34]|uniref:Uncharacterized protein n=1 Tax=Pyricularia oryzae (strain Y34) TaxID=1143189 RepID=A0AA97NN08_PYRO3|nr:hypothetical protein OOU_Y34scaffold00995g1 [Pyricularia oryzae Y34]
MAVALSIFLGGGQLRPAALFFEQGQDPSPSLPPFLCDNRFLSMPGSSPALGNNHDGNATSSRSFCKNAARSGLQRCGIGCQARESEALKARVQADT